MTALLKILQVILALAVLIVIHEAGHFSFARIFGIRVDKFFLFFDIGGVKLLSTKSGWFSKLFPRLKNLETEYGIGWLPLGGYCKISGMVDESLDMASLRNEPQPWEFRSKPVWQRILVMSGGVLFNFLLAVILYTSILSIWGDAYISNEDTAIYVNDLAYDMGFRTGDRILAFDDYVPEDFGMLQADLARRDVRKATILRDGDTLDLYIDQSMLGDVLATPGMFDVAVPFVIDTVLSWSPNAAAGLSHGDRVVGIAGESVTYVQDGRPVLGENAGGEVPVSLVRDDDTVTLDLHVDSLGRLGVNTVMPGIVRREYSFLSAIPGGVKMTFSGIGGYLRDLRLVFTPRTEAYKSVGSFIAIGQVFPSNWNWYQFLSILAILSVMLGVMNLIPIPGLDGGHILFGFYELFTRRKPSDKFMQIAQIIGMFILLALMVLAFGNDIGRLIH
ncbi:MAG: RIP metalloprotease RseP [Bacteroidales bacterium]|nr:RIP metalloprotease RseP [Bacteroidales bacterium]